MKISSLLKPLDDNSPCPINGKYKDVPMKNVPSSFLDWFLGQPHLMRKYPAVAKYCENPRVIKSISQDLEDVAEDSRLNWDGFNDE